MSFIFVLIFSCAMFVGCGKEEKEEIPSMVTEPEKWEIEVRPGYFGYYKLGHYDVIPNDFIERYIPEEEIKYVKEPISYADRDEFDQILITYPYCEEAAQEWWQYYPEVKCYYYNSKGERIESDYYARYDERDRYLGDETEFEKIKQDTGVHSWESAPVFAHSQKKDSLYRVKIKIYDSIESYRKAYDKNFDGYEINFNLSEHFMGWFDTYIVVKGIEGEEK